MARLQPLTAVACAVLLHLGGAGPACADGEPLSLRAAIASALRSNPELQGFAYALRAQDGRVRQAGVGPALELTVTTEDLLGTGAVNGLGNAELTLSLSRTIELGGKRARRIDAATAERDRLQAERGVRQLDLLAEVARRYIETAADQERLRLAQRATQLAAATRNAVQKRVDAARSPLAEASRAGILLARARLDEAALVRQLASDRQRLAALWGDAAPTFDTVQAALFTLPPVDEFAELTTRLAGNPDLAAFISEARLRDAELRLAVSQRTADVTITAGVRRLQDGRDQGLVFSASVPLGGRDRQAGNVLEAEARRDQVAADQAAAGLRVRTDLFALYQQLLQARAEVEGLERDVLPRASEALKLTEYAYERGRYSYLEWVDAQRELLEVERQHIDAAADYHLRLAEIERLTGEALARAPDATSSPSGDAR